VKLEIMEDFLPSPEQLAQWDDSVKFINSLSKASIEFFKEQANRHNVPFQKMILRLLDSYVRKYKRPQATGSKGTR
jgi:hypothetical protein